MSAWHRMPAPVFGTTIWAGASGGDSDDEVERVAGLEAALAARQAAVRNRPAPPPAGSVTAAARARNEDFSDTADLEADADGERDGETLVDDDDLAGSAEDDLAEAVYDTDIDEREESDDDFADDDDDLALEL